MSIKSNTRFSERTKHQVTGKSVIFETDLTTLENFSDVRNDSVPIYSSGNLQITKSTEQHFKKNYKRQEWIQNPLSGSTWNGEVLANYTEDSNSSDATQVLKRDYNGLQSFAYYGSCKELIRSSINHINETFPGEIYVNYIDTGGYKMKSSAYYDGTKVASGVNEEGLTCDCLCNNQFNIDIFSEAVSRSKSNKNLLKFFANDGFLNYEVIRPDGSSFPVRYWLVKNRAENYCFKPGEIVCEVELSAIEKTLGISTMVVNYDFEVGLDKRDGNYISFLVVKLDGGYGLLTNEKYLGYHVRPVENKLKEYYNSLSLFESVLINPNSTPKYKAVFEVILETETGYASRLENFIFPTDGGGYNLDNTSQSYNTYLQSLARLGITYDEFYSDNLYRTMTHESIKNMDFTKIEHGEDNEFTEGADKIAKVIRVVGRCFDELKAYIDGIENVHTISYNDKNNATDYTMSDMLEADGWDVGSVKALQQRKYYKHSGETYTEEVNFPYAQPLFDGRIIYYSGDDWQQFIHNKYYRCTIDNVSIQVTNYGTGEIEFENNGIRGALKTYLKNVPGWWAYAPYYITHDGTNWTLKNSGGTTITSNKKIDRLQFGITTDMLSEPYSAYTFCVSQCVWKEDMPIAAGEKIYTNMEPMDMCTNIGYDSSGRTYTIYREFSEVDGLSYQPYNVSGDGVFITCCGNEVPANGRKVMSETVKYVIYNGHKYYLNCDDKLLEVAPTTDSNDRLINGVIEHSIINGYVQLRGEKLPVQEETRVLYAVKGYSSSKEYTADEINYEFQKRLKLNSKHILRKKGTIRGIEEMLGLFGMMSDRFIRLSQDDKQASDYSIRESSLYTEPIYDVYNKQHKMPIMDWYNSVKNYHYQTPNSKLGIYDAYRGLPVKGVSYYVLSSGSTSGETIYTTDAYNYAGVKRTEAFRKVYPFFDKDGKYDSEMYYQMYGGWLKKTPYIVGKNGLVSCGDNFTETLRNVYAVKDIASLRAIPYDSLYDGFICEVEDNSTPYMNVNGELYEVKTESVRYINSSGILTNRTTVSYIEVPMYYDGFLVGNKTYFGNVAISNPCYSNYEERINLSELEAGISTKKKIYLYTYNGMEKEPVDIYNLNNYSGMTASNIYLDIAIIQESNGTTIYSNRAESAYMSFNNEYSNYWTIVDRGDFMHFVMPGNPNYKIGWERLKTNSPEVLRLDTIETIKTGNNPHSAKIPYDDGSEYLYRFVKLFKEPYLKEDFDNRCFQDVEEAYEEIAEFGFNNIFVDRYSSYINPVPLPKYDCEDMSGVSVYNLDKLVRYVGEEECSGYQPGHYYRATRGEDSGITWVEEFPEQNIINGLYDTKAHAFAKRKLRDGTVMEWGVVGNQLTDTVAYGDSPFPKLFDGDYDSNIDRIINTKYLDIEFHSDSADIELVKYYDVVLVHYIQQLLPSTLIAAIRFGFYNDCGIGCMIVEDNFIVR